MHLRVSHNRSPKPEAGVGGEAPIKSGADSGFGKHMSIRSAPCEALTSDCRKKKKQSSDRR